ncbi:MAG: GNAT family N-acetyltransferase [Paracoccus sp. (in: a-proteobacteria)]|nr:GNAT family N-acetyltransferase [Paracoccus sp. (in: a-proteobacteria)]
MTRDLDAVRAIAAAAYAPYVAEIGQRPAPMDADYAALIAAGEVFVTGRPVLGFVVCRAQPGAMLLENVAVAPKAAGQGLGRALIGFAEARARAQGLAEIRLYTNAAMARNIALYQRLGYIQGETRIEDGFRRVFFSKPL